MVIVEIFMLISIGKKLLFAASDDAVLATCQIICCDADCIRSNFPVLKIKMLREEFHINNEVEKSNWLLRKMQTFYSPEIGWCFVVLGFSICRVGFCQVYGISNGKFYAVKQKLNLNVQHIIHGNTGYEHSAKKQSLCRNYLEGYIQKYADTSPLHPNIFYLPMQISKMDLYEEMIKFFDFSGVEKERLPGIMTFLLVWSRDFKSLKCTRKTILGRCSFCVEVNQKISSAITNQSRLEFRLAKNNHLNQIKFLRTEYAKRIEMAKLHPALYSSWVLDYCDPIKIPHIFPFPAACLTKSRVKFEICGLMDHGAARNYIYWHLPHFSHSANLGCSIFFQQICNSISSSQLSKNLFLQADNCAKETHNNIFFALCAYLVQIHIFDSITLSNLLPGHTHIDIDNIIFGSVKSKLKHHNIESPDQFVKEYLPLLHKRRTHKLEPIMLSHLYNWELFFKDSFHTCHGHGNCHQFKWTIPTGDTTVSFFYRKKMDIGPWFGSSESIGFKPFTQLPSGVPELILPVDIPTGELSDIQFHFRWMSAYSKAWWINFMENQKNIYPEHSSQNPEEFWPVPTDVILPPPLVQLLEPEPQLQLANHLISITIGDIVIVKNQHEIQRNYKVAIIMETENTNSSSTSLVGVNFLIGSENGNFVSVIDVDADPEWIAREDVVEVIQLTKSNAIHKHVLNRLRKQNNLGEIL